MLTGEQFYGFLTDTGKSRVERGVDKIEGSQQRSDQSLGVSTSTVCEILKKKES